jgi:uncharacterized membrane protein
MSTYKPSIIEALKLCPFPKAASWALVFVAFAQLLDAITTVIGVSLGLVESFPLSVAIMQASGLSGFVLVKGATAILCLWFARVFQRKSRNPNPTGGMVAFILFGIIWNVLPIVNNIFAISLKMLCLQ